MWQFNERSWHTMGIRTKNETLSEKLATQARKQKKNNERDKSSSRNLQFNEKDPKYLLPKCCPWDTTYNVHVSQQVIKKKVNSLPTKLNVLEKSASKSLSLIRDNWLATVYKVRCWLMLMAYMSY